MNSFVTGGTGFIGSAVIRFLVNHSKHEVINIDKVTYAGNLESLIEIENNPRYRLETVDICDADGLAHLFTIHNPDAV